MPLVCPFSTPSERARSFRIGSGLIANLFRFRDSQFAAELLCRVSTLANFAACRHRLYAARMLGPPLAKIRERLSQGSPERCEAIFGLREYLSEIDTIDYPV